MDINKSFTYSFEDKQWITKLGLGAVIAIIPILNFAWSGYMVGIMRNVMSNEAEPLPNWDDIGKKFMDGLMLALAGLVYALPMLVVICLPMGFMVIPAMMSGNGDMQDIANALAGTGSVLFLCLLCVFVIYALVLSVIYPAILVLYAREGTFASCFKFREVFDIISKNTAAFFTAWGVSLGAGLVIGFAAGLISAAVNIIPCIGQILSFLISMAIVVYTSSVYSHLFGQFGSAVFGQSQFVEPAV
jgi:hypothetical protein